jgi:hypothetical protein
MRPMLIGYCDADREQLKGRQERRVEDMRQAADAQFTRDELCLHRQLATEC